MQGRPPKEGPRRPSQLTAGQLKDPQTRLQRLAGVLQIYCRSLIWSMNELRGWKLGEPRCRFVLLEEELWDLGIETVEDFYFAGWGQHTAILRARKRSRSFEGSFSKCRLRENLKRVKGRRRPQITLVPISLIDVSRGKKSRGPQKVVFTNPDWVKLVEFIPGVEHVPSYGIAQHLQHAFHDAETPLLVAGFKWGGTPLFEQCGDCVAFDQYAKSRRLRPTTAIRNLITFRDKQLAEIESASRQHAQRPPPTPEEEDVLIAMLELGATDANRRTTSDKIATHRSKGAGKMSPPLRVIARLGRMGLVESKKGVGGGCWLTLSGKCRAEQILHAKKDVINRA